MKLRRLVPSGGEVQVGEILAAVGSADDAPAPFGDEVRAVCRELSARLLAPGAGEDAPELQALGYWLRPAAVERLARQWEEVSVAGCRRVPRGVVLHLPPSNVDVQFVYSWLLAFLTGNRGVIRLSNRASEVALRLCGLLEEAFAAAGRAPGGPQHTLVVSYPHDEGITAALSAAADVRVLWGSDSTVAEIRPIPLPPRSVELVFPDRVSWCALAAGPVVSLDETALRELAERLFRDIYTFDQRACASPRLVAWVGEAGDADVAAGRLWPALAEVVRERRYPVATGTALEKIGERFRAVLDLPVTSTRQLGNELAVVRLERPSAVRGESCGAGLLYEMVLPRLVDLAALVDQRDQTLVHFGFEAAEAENLADAVGGRGLDRIVPVGGALEFDRVWDGHDLLTAFTRLLRVMP